MRRRIFVSISGYTLYTSIYFHTPSYTLNNLHIPSYTPIYFKISNIRKMRPDIRPKNGHNSGPMHPPTISPEVLPYPNIIKILKIRKTTANIRPKNGHNSGPRASPMDVTPIPLKVFSYPKEPIFN